MAKKWQEGQSHGFEGGKKATSQRETPFGIWTEGRKRAHSGV